MLTKDHPILSFPEVYALKLLAGESAFIIFENGATSFCDLDAVLDEVDQERINESLIAFAVSQIHIIGFIRQNRFEICDVIFNDDYLAVPHAKNVADYLKLSFVPYKKMSTKSLRRIKKYKPVELRPLDEFVMEDGTRLIAQYRKEN